MEKENKTTKRLLAIFWVLIYTLPLIYLIFNIINVTFNKSAYIVNTDVFNDDAYFTFLKTSFKSVDYAFTMTKARFSILQNSYMYNILNDFQKLILGVNNANDYMQFVSITLSWYIMAKLLHIVIDFIMILPNICKKLFRKGGLDNE